MTKDIVEKAATVMFWIFFIISVILFLWYVFGSSPTVEQLLAGWLGVLTSEFFRIEYRLGQHGEAINNINRKLDEIKSLIGKINQ